MRVVYWLWKVSFSIWALGMTWWLLIMAVNSLMSEHGKGVWM